MERRPGRAGDGRDALGARTGDARPPRGGAAVSLPIAGNGGRADANGGVGGGNKVPRMRLSMLAVVAMALFASLFARLYDLQVVGSSDYQVQAEANRVRTVQVPASRGRILDRNGKVLVDNRVAVVVAVDRNAVNDLAKDKQADLLERLSRELTAAGHPITPDQITQRLADKRYSRYAPVPVAADVPEALKIYLDEHRDQFPAVEVERAAVRDYPYGRLGAHILGYVGKINDDELTFVADHKAKPYTLNDEIGKTGVERTYEPYLRGTPGLRRIEVDADGDPVRVISEREPRPGDDLVLTIDVDLQALAEQRLQEGLADARARPPRKDNPPNHYPLNNWAIQGQWAPGSTYKPFVGYAALRSGLMAPDTVFFDGGGY